MLRVNSLIVTKANLKEVQDKLNIIYKYNETNNVNYSNLTKKQSGINERLEWAPLQAIKSHYEAKVRRLTNGIKNNRQNKLVSKVFK